VVRFGPVGNRTLASPTSLSLPTAWGDTLQELKIEASTNHADAYNASFEALYQEEKELKSRIAHFEQDIECALFPKKARFPNPPFAC